MNEFIKELLKIRTAKKTENGDNAYTSTGNNLVDLFFMTAYFEKHLDQANIGTSDKEKLFSMFVRDPRFGLGRRDLGRRLMRLSNVTPENIVKAGRYDDLLYCPTDENIAYLKVKLNEDALAKKWMPRLTGKDRQVAKILCAMWGITEKEYRKLIKTDTTEYKLSYAEPDNEVSPLNELFKQGNYKHPLVDKIDFEKVPSMAMAKYLHCFSTRQDLKDRFAEYINNVKEKKAKINVKTANVHDAHKIAVGGFAPQSVEQVARDVVAEKIVDNATLDVAMDAIVILDTSGSMWTGWGWEPDFTNMNQIGAKAMSVAYAISSKSTYAPNQLIAFSSAPHLMTIKGDTMKEKFESMYTGDCTNTNFAKVMEILKGLKKYPQYLVVLTDMEFDQGSQTTKEKTMKMFREAGAPTRIIWWNFNDRNRTTPEIDEWGNYYISGYNLQILKLLENGLNMDNYIDKILEKYKKDIDYKE